MNKIKPLEGCRIFIHPHFGPRVKSFTGLIERHGGAVVPSDDASTTHIVVDPRSQALSTSRVASEEFLSGLSKISTVPVVKDSWLTETFRSKTREAESAHSPVPPPPPPIPQAPAARRPLQEDSDDEKDAGDRDPAGGRISSCASFVVYDAFGEGAPSSPGGHGGGQQGSRVLVVTWNCRGLANAKEKGGDLLAGWLREVVKGSDEVVLGITETWIVGKGWPQQPFQDAKATDAVRWIRDIFQDACGGREVFAVWNNHENERKAGSGVLSTLPFRSVSVGLHGLVSEKPSPETAEARGYLCTSHPDPEGRLITVHCQSLILALVYTKHPGMLVPGGPQRWGKYRVEDWDPAMRAHLCRLADEARARGAGLVCMGDFNVHLQGDPARRCFPEMCTAALKRSMEDTLEATGLLDVWEAVQGPWGDEEEWGRTFWGLREHSRGVGVGMWGRLDYILASPNLLVSHPVPPECLTSGNKCFGSDHGILRALLALPQAATCTAPPLESPDEDRKAPTLQGAEHGGTVESQAPTLEVAVHAGTVESEATSFVKEAKQVVSLTIGTVPHGEQDGEGDVKRRRLE